MPIWVAPRLMLRMSQAAEGAAVGLVVSALTAGYTKVPVVSNVSFKAFKGHVSAIIGPNGSGKSTLLKAIVGLVEHEGNVTLNGQDVSSWSTHRIVRHGLGYVPQVQNVFPSLTVLENLETGAFFKRDRLRVTLKRVFAMFPDLEVASNKKAGSLSGGQRTMLAIARVLMADPSVVVMDEPTAGLAPIYVEAVWRQVRTIRDTGAAVIVVEQNVDQALSHADFVDVLVAGRCVITGTAAEASQRDLGAIFLGALTPDANPKAALGTAAPSL